MHRRLRALRSLSCPSAAKSLLGLAPRTLLRVCAEDPLRVCAEDPARALQMWLSLGSSEPAWEDAEHRLALPGLRLPPQKPQFPPNHSHAGRCTVASGARWHGLSKLGEPVASVGPSWFVFSYLAGDVLHLRSG